MQRELVEAARAGDHGAFAALAEAAVGRLCDVARLILRDSDLAQDAVQEALVRAWIECPRLRDPARWDAWLHRLTVNACIDETRRRRRWAAQVRWLDVEPSEADGSHHLADRDQLDRGFRRLRPEQRAALVLRFYLGLTAPEVALALDVPLGTAKSRIHFSVEALRAALAAEQPPMVVATEGGRP